MLNQLGTTRWVAELKTRRGRLLRGDACAKSALEGLWVKG